jgi:hypothetical protein
VFSVLPFTLLSQTIQWPLKKRVNGRTDHTMVINKNGKWKDRQYKPPERRVNGRTPFTLLFNGHCIFCPSIYHSF